MRALVLRANIRELQRRHQCLPTLHVLPLGPVQSGPVILSGIAATTDRDHDRMQLAPDALILPPDPAAVPLLANHNPTQRVGAIQSLQLDHRGTLHIRARVEHEAARRLPAFSVGLRLLDGALIDADSANFYGLLKRAEISEISLTDKPSNPHALVLDRHPSCRTDFCDAAITALQLINRKLEIIGRLQHARP
jgi:hypothetical protein